MTNPVIIGAKLNLKRSALTTITDALQELLNKRSELEAAVADAQTEEDLAALESQVNENEEEIQAKEDEKSKLEEEIQELEDELERSNQKVPTNRSKENGGKSNMENRKELRSAINAFIRTQGAEQQTEVEGFKVVDGGVLVPEELLAPEQEVQDVVNLKDYVKVVPTKRGSGKYPVLKKSGSRLYAVEELEKNPELAKPKIDNIDYSIETYRGYIPISQEVIDDADYDILGLISEDIKDQEVNTSNYAIATVLKTAEAKTVKNLDELISLLNKGFKTAYNVKLYVSQSLFDELDHLKYEDGRYILSEDVTVLSGKRLKGKEIIILDDDLIGEEDGDLVGFIGDAKAFAKFFDRKQTSLKWVNNDLYGQVLAVVDRFDVEAGDEAAGYYITFGEENTTPEG